MAIKNSLIAVSGAPGAGKSVFSIMLAKALSEYKENILIIFADDFSPPLPYVIKEPRDGSIGKLLMMSSISSDGVLENLVISEDHKRILMLGFNFGENSLIYPTFKDEDIRDMIIYLKSMFDWIIVDTTSYFLSNVISRQAIRSSDVLINVYDKSAKSLSYMESVGDILEKEKSYNSVLISLTNASKKCQNDGAFDDYVMGNDFVFDWIEEIDDKYQSSDLFKKMTSNKFKNYKETLDSLVTSKIISDEDE